MTDATTTTYQHDELLAAILREAQRGSLADQTAAWLRALALRDLVLWRFFRKFPEWERMRADLAAEYAIRCREWALSYDVDRASCTNDRTFARWLTLKAERDLMRYARQGGDGGAVRPPQRLPGGDQGAVAYVDSLEHEGEEVGSPWDGFTPSAGGHHEDVVVEFVDQMRRGIPPVED